MILSGEDEIAEVTGGTSLEFQEEDDGIRAVIPPAETRLELGPSQTFLDVKSSRPNHTDSLTIFGHAGQTLSFEQGESGTVEESEDGNIIVTNSDQDRSTTLEDGFELLGEAKGILSSSNRGDRFTPGWAGTCRWNRPGNRRQSDGRSCFPHGEPVRIRRGLLERLERNHRVVVPEHKRGFASIEQPLHVQTGLHHEHDKRFRLTLH